MVQNLLTLLELNRLLLIDQNGGDSPLLKCHPVVNHPKKNILGMGGFILTEKQVDTFSGADNCFIRQMKNRTARSRWSLKARSTPRERFWKAGKKLLSKNIAPPCRVESISPIGESFGFRIFPAEDKISSWRPLRLERSGRFSSESVNRF